MVKLTSKKLTVWIIIGLVLLVSTYLLLAYFGTSSDVHYGPSLGGGASCSSGCSDGSYCNVVCPDDGSSARCGCRIWPFYWDKQAFCECFNEKADVIADSQKGIPAGISR